MTKKTQQIVPSGILDKPIFAPKPAKVTPGEAEFGQWQARPTGENMQQIMSHAEPEIQRSLSQYGYAGDPVMAGKARVMVARAVPRYNPKMGAFRTFVNRELQGLRRVGLEMQPVKVPERAYYDNLNLQRAEKDTGSELGRSPTLAELADRTGVSPKRIAKLRAGWRTPIAEEATRMVDESGQEELTGFERPTASEMFQEAYYSGISDPVDRLIFEGMTGYGGRKVRSKTQLAKSAGISVAAVSQRATKLSNDYNEVMDKMDRVMR